MLLDAFAEMPDLQLKIVGTGVEIETYKAKATPNVEFLGYRQRDQLNELLVGAKAVIVPSQVYETFGMVIVEAYAAHKAVIVGDIGNVAILVDDNKTGLKFKYDDKQALVAAVKSLEQIDWRAMGIRGYVRYMAEFSPERNYQKLKAVYDKVMR